MSINWWFVFVLFSKIYSFSLYQSLLCIFCIQGFYHSIGKPLCQTGTHTLYYFTLSYQIIYQYWIHPSSLPAFKAVVTHTHTPTDNLEFPIYHTYMIPDCGRKLEYYANMQYPQRKAPGLGSEPSSSCCETHLTLLHQMFTAVNSNNLFTPINNTKYGQKLRWH